jgi:hypothetical protein
MKEVRVKWKVTVVLVLLGLASLFLFAIHEEGRQDDKDRAITLEERREYVSIMNRTAGQGALSLGGPDEDVLVLDVRDCGPNALHAMLSDDRIVGTMMRAGFRQIRCKDNPAVADVPAH